MYLPDTAGEVTEIAPVPADEDKSEKPA
jgi:hypothetical protein